MSPLRWNESEAVWKEPSLAPQEPPCGLRSLPQGPVEGNRIRCPAADEDGRHPAVLQCQALHIGAPPSPPRARLRSPSGTTPRSRRRRDPAASPRLLTSAPVSSGRTEWSSSPPQSEARTMWMRPVSHEAAGGSARQGGGLPRPVHVSRDRSLPRRCLQLPAGGQWSRSALVSGCRSGRHRGSLRSLSQGWVPGRAPRDTAGSLGCPWPLVIPDWKKQNETKLYIPSRDETPARPWKVSCRFSGFSLTSKHLLAASPES